MAKINSTIQIYKVFKVLVLNPHRRYPKCLNEIRNFWVKFERSQLKHLISNSISAGRWILTAEKGFGKVAKSKQAVQVENTAASLVKLRQQSERLNLN